MSTKTVGDEIQAFMRELAPNIAAASDEEWEARDRSIEQPAVVPQVRPHRETLLDLNWPKRPVEAAEQADEQREAIRRIADWDWREFSVCILSGRAGTGKTVAAAWYALRKCMRVEFVRAATFAASSRYDAQTRSRWYGAHAMCLDDLGAEYLDAKGSFLVDLDELVDTFHADRRPLIITTNIAKQNFRTRYGDRVADRFHESAVWISITGTSIRQGGRL